MPLKIADSFKLRLNKRDNDEVQNSLIHTSTGLSGTKRAAINDPDGPEKYQP
jgi:hypothetical protein